MNPYPFALLNHLTLPVMRIVLSYVLRPGLAVGSLNQPRPQHWVRSKKKGRVFAAFPLRRQARPASREIILDFHSYAKSLTERLRQDRHRRLGTRPDLARF